MNIDFVLLRKYDRILEALKKAKADAAIVAGGAVRDMIMNKPIKDIDVFYVGDLDVDLLKKELIFPNEATAPAQLDFYHGSNWKLSYNQLKIEDCGYPIQLVQVKKDKRKTYPPFQTLINNVFTFGCNLSMCIYNQGGGLTITEEALNDMFLEQLTFNEHLGRYSDYPERLIAKYPEFVVENYNPRPKKKGVIQGGIFDNPPTWFTTPTDPTEWVTSTANTITGGSALGAGTATFIATPTTANMVTQGHTGWADDIQVLGDQLDSNF